jgi:hypothetical protein
MGSGSYGMNSHEANKAVLEIMLNRQKAKENKETKLQQKDCLKKNWEKNNEDIRVLEDKHSLVKARLEFVRRILKEYYFKLLNQGTDIR